MSASIDLPCNGRGRTDLIYKTVGVTQIDFENMLSAKVKFEKFDSDAEKILCCGTVCSNGLISAVHEAFANERPLILSPDMIAVAIHQAFATQINNSPEEFRDVLVHHKDKKEIVVRHHGLVQGDPTSTWELCFEVFGEALQKDMKDKTLTDSALSKFSTTTELAQVCRTVALMDAVQQFYDYKVVTMCGIPRITLLGTAEDWAALATRAEAVCKVLKMEKWAHELVPVLTHFVQLASDATKASPVFWEHIYSKSGASGSGHMPACNGWINVFFPFRNDKKWRRTEPVTDPEEFHKLLARPEFWLEQAQNSSQCRKGRGEYFACQDIEYADYPSGLSVVPFVWEYHDKEFKMRFAAGFLNSVAVETSDDNAAEKNQVSVRPALAWSVYYDK